MKILTLTTLLALSALLTGCANDADAICEKRQSCFDDDLDTGACAKRIDNWVDDKDTKQRQDRVAECSRCINDRTCAQVLQSCIDDCFGIP